VNETVKPIDIFLLRRYTNRILEKYIGNALRVKFIIVAKEDKINVIINTSRYFFRPVITKAARVA
jgi:hypothetical protein